MRLGVVGAGAVGTAVALLLAEKGYEVVGFASRTPASAQRAAERLKAKAFLEPAALAREVEVLFITTPDQAIAPVAAQIAAEGGFLPGQVVVHMSGSLTSKVLEPASLQGALVVSIHPLQSCPTVERAVENLPSSVFSIEGDPRAFPLAEKIVHDLGGVFFYIDPEVKPLYHAAACVASNYLVSLVDLSRQLLKVAGMPEELFFRGIYPLIFGTLQNIREVKIPRALTGPIARGDVGTVEDHLLLMRSYAPELLALYSALGEYTTRVAEEKGTLGVKEAAHFRALFRRELEAFLEGSRATRGSYPGS